MAPSKKLWQTLADHALAAREAAYAPYSRFSVGAALLIARDEGDEPLIISGCNVENASFGLAICAERTAVARAVASGHREFGAIAIASGSEDPAPPCGMCLQVLVEFCDDIDILLLNDSGTELRTKLSRLIPTPFRIRDPQRMR